MRITFNGLFLAPIIPEEGKENDFIMSDLSGEKSMNKEKTAIDITHFQDHDDISQYKDFLYTGAMIQYSSFCHLFGPSEKRIRQ